MIGSPDHDVGAVEMGPIEALENIENKLVEERRYLASELTKFKRPDEADSFADLVEIQRKIDVVKSAIEDEKSRGPSVYEDPDTKL